MFSRRTAAIATTHTSTPPHLNIPQLLKWLRQAGRMALNHYQQVAAVYKPDRSWVTQADTDIEAFISKSLYEAYPEFGLIAEEGARHTAELPYLWTLDPLDGTTAFIHGLPNWGIGLGLLCHGRPCFGAFYMPLLDDLTYRTESGVHLERSTYTETLCANPTAEWEDKGFLAVSSARYHQKFDIQLARVHTVGSVGATLMYVARGTAAAALIPKARLWDLVAGAAILEPLGMGLCYLSGAPISYTDLYAGQLAPEPILAGPHTLLPLLRPRILPKSA